jgi:hypothetical protein
MGKQSNRVSVQLSKLFFDNIFEPERRKLEKQTGTRVTQVNFTEFLAKRKVKFVLPKQNKKFLSDKSLMRRKLK